MKNFLDQNGQPPWGILSNPAGTINYRDYPLRSAYRELLPESERHRQFIHFQFMGFTSRRFIAGCSVTLVGDIKTAFFYLFDRQSKELNKFGFRLADRTSGTICLDPDDGLTSLSKNNYTVQFNNDLSSNTKSLHVSSSEELELTLRFSEKDYKFETLRLCTPTGANGWTYCQKVAGIPATGHLKYKGEIFSLNELGAAAHHDYTAGFLRKDTFWNWACINGIQPNGDVIGLNVSNGVNETGASENRVWLNGKSEDVGHFMFSYNPDNLENDWQITSDCGTKLTFNSEGKYAAFNNELSTGFDFHQLFGNFTGKIVTCTGKKIAIHNLPGFCERQYSIWYD